MKTALLILLVVFCVDRWFEIDRCFSEPERAAFFCDISSDCRGLYVREDSRNV